MTSKIKGLNRVIWFEGLKTTSFSNIIDFTIIRAGDCVPNMIICIHTARIHYVAIE